MEIILFHPDIKRCSQKLPSLFPCLGVNILSTVLKKRGHQVEVWDPLKIALWEQQPGNQKGKLLESIDISNTKMIGISTLLQTRHTALEIARWAKTKNPDLMVVLGGSGASILVAELLLGSKDTVDVIVVGEGERTIVELADCIERKVSIESVNGLVYKNKTGLACTPPQRHIKNLDEVPFPDYDDYLNLLPNGVLETACMLTCRGCRFNCNFCACRSLWNRQRGRTARNVVEELKQLRAKYGVNRIRFHDDVFGDAPSKYNEILQGIIDLRSRFSLYAHSRYGSITQEILKQFLRAGGECFYFGLESGSTSVRARMGKRVSDETIIETSRWVKKLGMKLGLFLMFGYPGETINDHRRTWRLLEKIDPDEVYCSTTKIEPGTDLYRIALQKDIMHEDDWMTSRREYFSFLQQDEELLTQGIALAFRERFNKSAIREGFETNSDFMGLEEDPIQAAIFKKEALRLIQ